MKIGVVGGGVFGLASAWELARRGHEVTVFERRRIPAPDASGTDISKAIRLEYGAATSLYAPLVARAFTRWQEVEEITGKNVYHRCGVLFLSRAYEPGGFEHESQRQLTELGLAGQVLEAGEAARRWPQFNWSEMTAAVHNHRGGWLAAARAVEALADCARAEGVTIHEEAPVENVYEASSGAVVRVDITPHEFDQVVVAAGPWLGKLFPYLSSGVRVSRQRITHYQPADPSGFDYPVWVWDIVNSGWYGFPANPDGIVKVALHRRSETVDADVERVEDPEFLKESRAFTGVNLPGLAESPVSGRVCLYTNSPSGDFLIDRLPGSERIVLAGCGSGHAFKFGPVLGELVADLLESDELNPAFRLGAVATVETW
ncbi:MAG: FAD-dependent oxidoreductase [Candidatus Eremiobacteraeota bacterium]|nr:FAD-dependent oxidoreductase [Candidatus Eremiobacteraeota bacterium]